jgi:hypothetical protein
MTTNNLGKISASKHAIDRAVERFRVNPSESSQWIKDNVELSTFVANIVGEDGRTVRLYAHKRAAFILADTTDFVLTVYAQHSVEHGLRAKVRSLIERELRLAEKAEKSATHLANVERAKLEIEIAQCNYRMYVTPSRAVVAMNVKRLEHISDEIAVINARLLEVKRQKSEIARSIVAYI